MRGATDRFGNLPADRVPIGCAERTTRAIVAVVDGRASRKEIKVGIVEGKRIEVVSGLEGGEQVVEANAASLVEGQPVVRNEPAADAAKPKS